MTLTGKWVLKDGSLQYYSSKLQRNDSTRQLLRPFTLDQLRENYCQGNTKLKLILLNRENTTTRSQNTLITIQLDLGNNYHKYQYLKTTP